MLKNYRTNYNFCNFVAILIQFVAIMDSTLLKYIDRLKANGFSNTTSRFRVFEQVRRSKAPLPISIIISKLNGKVDRATIYRTEELFQKLGITKRVYSGWKFSVELGDDFQEHHHHMTCTSCGKIFPIDLPEIENALVKLGRANNFHITDHTVELRGLCDACQN